MGIEYGELGVNDLPRNGSAGDKLPVPAPTRHFQAGAMEHFICALLPPREAGEVLRGFYTDALHTVLLERLAEWRSVECVERRSGQRPLAKWRLSRVYEFIEANIEQRITLEALGQAAGVSRMYFAAQFRAATGLRPHDYLIRRRVALARDMLSKTDTPIVNIASSVGFQTQSHFTTVFKRNVGFSPKRWRDLHNS
jgi:AraC-like DNA-binding protein